MKSLYKNPLFYLSFALALVVGFQVYGIVAAESMPYTSPLQAPALGNPARPLDESTTTQTKAGNLMLKGICLPANSSGGTPECKFGWDTIGSGGTGGVGWNASGNDITNSNGGNVIIKSGSNLAIAGAIRAYTLTPTTLQPYTQTGGSCNQTTGVATDAPACKTGYRQDSSVVEPDCQIYTAPPSRPGPDDRGYNVLPISRAYASKPKNPYVVSRHCVPVSAGTYSYVDKITFPDVNTTQIINSLKVVDSSGKKSFWDGVKWVKHGTEISCDSGKGRSARARVNDGVVEVKIDTSPASRSNWTPWDTGYITEEGNAYMVAGNPNAGVNQVSTPGGGITFVFKGSWGPISLFFIDKGQKGYLEGLCSVGF